MPTFLFSSSAGFSHGPALTLTSRSKGDNTHTQTAKLLKHRRCLDGWTTRLRRQGGCTFRHKYQVAAVTLLHIPSHFPPQISMHCIRQKGAHSVDGKRLREGMLINFPPELHASPQQSKRYGHNSPPRIMHGSSACSCFSVILQCILQSQALCYQGCCDLLISL